MKFKFSAALFISFSFFLPTSFVQSDASSKPPETQIRSAYAEKIKVSGVGNAGKVDEHLFRGANPSTAGLLEIKKLGITTIVDLRNLKGASLESTRRQVESQGLKFVSIPVGGFSSPDDQQILQFLSLVNGGSNQKIFVHCKFGEDRTGVFIAAYRMAVLKWPARQALSEMNFFGFNHNFQPLMKHYVLEFPDRLNSTVAFSAFREAQPLAPVGHSRP